MNKTELVEKISEQLDFHKSDVEQVVNKLVEVIVGSVKKGRKVHVSGLGSFEKIRRSARTGINPATGKKMQIPAKNAPKFKSAKNFKQLVA